MNERSGQDLAGKTALVTGSTSGIGLAIASALLEAGAATILNGKTSAQSFDLAGAGLKSSSIAKASYCPADLSTAQGCEELADYVRETCGHIDILINNAGIQFVSPIEDFPQEKWDQIIAINLTSGFILTRELIGGMRQKGWGRIINIASAHGLVGSPYKSAYVAAKHGMLGLTKVIALETAEEGITCNAICPGYVDTPLVQKQIDNQASAHGVPRDQVIRDVILAPQPNKKFATLDEVAALVLFLCSSSADSITGASLPIDGGWTAR